MNEKTCKSVRLYYGIALGAMTVILGVLFIWQVLDNFISGVVPGEEYIFTQTGLLARFQRIGPAFWIWVIMIVGGFVVWEVFPVRIKKQAYRDPRYILARLNKRIPNPSAEMLKREKILKILWLAFAVFALAGIIYAITYLAIPSHFSGKGAGKPTQNREVLNMVINVFPWVLAAFVAACVICIYEGISAKRLLPEARKLAAGNKPIEKVHGKIYKFFYNKNFKLGLRIAIGCCAVAFIIAGALNGNVANVLTKAINICMECVGLG